MAIPDEAVRRSLGKDETSEGRLSLGVEARLRALDAMLGGIAHDLNNALSVVLMNLDVMHEDAAVIGKHARRIDGMFDAMTNASALVRHLLNFSHSRRPEPDVISLAEVLQSLVELLRVAAGKDIEIAVEMAEEIGPCCVVADAASLEVAVVHTALQFAATMQSGGALTFRLGKSGAPGDEVVLELDVEPRSAAAPIAGRGVDLALLEHFARDARGSVTTSAAGGELYGVAVRLPACAETTAI